MPDGTAFPRRPNGAVSICGDPSKAERELGYAPHPNQIETALALLAGKVVDLATGEGKTLAAALAASLLAAAGRGVHDATANSYLARRDAKWMGPLYTLLKALTAIQLAEQVSAQYGVPAVPVFWVEAEDHDWAEVKGCTVLDADLSIVLVAPATAPVMQALLADLHSRYRLPETLIVSWAKLSQQDAHALFESWQVDGRKTVLVADEAHFARNAAP